jgi:hypothetical protein
MDRVYIAWSVENWITVLLMATLGYLLFSAVWQVFQKYSGNSGA